MCVNSLWFLKRAHRWSGPHFDRIIWPLYSRSLGLVFLCQWPWSAPLWAPRTRHTSIELQAAASLAWAPAFHGRERCCPEPAHDSSTQPERGGGDQGRVCCTELSLWDWATEDDAGTEEQRGWDHDSSISRVPAVGSPVRLGESLNVSRPSSHANHSWIPGKCLKMLTALPLAQCANKRKVRVMLGC